MTHASARRHTTAVAVAVAVTAAAALALAGCTTSGHGSTRSSTPPTSVAPTTPTPTPTSSAPSTPQAPTSQSPSTAGMTSTPSAPSSTSAAPAPPTSSAPTLSTCRSLTIQVLPGGASFGEQIAGLKFINTGTRPCLLVGYPAVTLLRNGKQIGQPAQPASTAASIRRLGPGKAAESLLHDYTQTCQAPLSDSVRVRAPGSVQTLVRPGMTLRACVLRVDKLGAPD